MLARTSLGTVSRRALRVKSLAIPGSQAAFSNGPRPQEPAKSVLSYLGGQRSQSEIDLNLGSNGPVTPPGSDVQKTAKPLKHHIYAQLTPTLHKFTLRDKVAVVTG